MAELLDREKLAENFEKILLKSMKAPGVKINRAKFLRKELLRYYPENIIEAAIDGNPAKAGIPREQIDKISKHVIAYETTKVTGVSVVASIPGGTAAIGAATGDLISYFAFVLRAVQKLAYLYGFDQFDLDDENMDSETMNYVLLFMGVMFGVRGASGALQKVANTFAKQFAKNLAKQPLTKGVIYPIVKTIAKKIGYQMTKQIFADGVASAIPIAGGVLSGGLTLAMYAPGCMKLRKTLGQYNLCNPEYYNATIVNAVEVEDESGEEEDDETVDEAEPEEA